LIICYKYTNILFSHKLNTAKTAFSHKFKMPFYPFPHKFEQFYGLSAHYFSYNIPANKKASEKSEALI
jgi:hypothetical protein